MFSVALLLLLAAGCESLWICQSQQFFCDFTWLFVTKHFLSFFKRCEVWTVDTASLCDCAARSTSHHHLSGLWLFSWQLLHSLDQTACRERTGVDWNGSYWIHHILCWFTEEQVQYRFRLFQQNSDSKWTECAAWRHCCVLLCQKRHSEELQLKSHTKTTSSIFIYGKPVVVLVSLFCRKVDD